MLRVKSWQGHRRTGRVLRASRSSLEGGTGGAGDAARDGGLGTFGGGCCRVCWGEESKDEVGGGGQLVAPCKCSGSMKYIHLKCLSTWQAQLRKQKGWKGASCCDVCKTRWKEGFVNIDRASKNSNSLLPALADRAQNFLESLHPHLLTILHGWKAIALAQGFLMGVETGMKGFRLGLRYHSMSLASKIQVGLPLSDAFSSTTQAEFSSLMKWSPLSFWAAGVFCRTVRLPTVASLVPIPIHLLSAGMLGVRGRLLALLGMYAGAIAGFYRGVASTTGVTVNLALKSPWLVSSLVKTAVRSAVHILLKIVARR